MALEGNDFKYVLQDVSRVYIGARYTYREMMDTDEIPFKFKAVLSHYVLKEVAAGTSVDQHIFFIKESDVSYLVYHQLKAVFKLSIWHASGKEGHKKSSYNSRCYTIDQIVKDKELQAHRDEIIVEEIMFSKFTLMTLSL